MTAVAGQPWTQFQSLPGQTPADLTPEEVSAAKGGPAAAPMMQQQGTPPVAQTSQVVNGQPWTQFQNTPEQPATAGTQDVQKPSLGGDSGLLHYLGYIPGAAEAGVHMGASLVGTALADVSSLTEKAMGVSDADTMADRAKVIDYVANNPLFNTETQQGQDIEAGVGKLFSPVTDMVHEFVGNKVANSTGSQVYGQTAEDLANFAIAKKAADIAPVVGRKVSDATLAGVKAATDNPLSAAAATAGAAGGLVHGGPLGAIIGEALVAPAAKPFFDSLKTEYAKQQAKPNWWSNPDRPAAVTPPPVVPTAPVGRVEPTMNLGEPPTSTAPAPKSVAESVANATPEDAMHMSTNPMDIGTSEEPSSVGEAVAQQATGRLSPYERINGEMLSLLKTAPELKGFVGQGELSAESATTLLESVKGMDFIKQHLSPEAYDRYTWLKDARDAARESAMSQMQNTPNFRGSARDYVQGITNGMTRSQIMNKGR